MGYITSPAGIFKIITAVLGVVIFGLALASWPRQTIRDAVKEDSSEGNLWKFYIFFAFSIIALLFSLATVAAFAFMGKVSGGIKKGDGGASILVGLLLLITAALLLQEIVSKYDDYKTEICGSAKGLSLPFERTSVLAGARSIDDDIKAMEKCYEDLDITDPDSPLNACKCQVRVLLKFGVNVGAASIAILNFIAFCVAGGLGLKG